MFKAMKIGFGLVIGATLADFVVYAVCYLINGKETEENKDENEAEA